MQLETPEVLIRGHESLYEDLEIIISFGGEIGEKTKQLAKMLHSHFKKEEEYALPPLGLLLELADGRWNLDASTVVKMADKLQSQLSEMKNEHENIRVVLNKLKNISNEENKNTSKIHRFINDLSIHIDIEDQVLYPAAILVGNYLKKLKSEQ